MSALCARVGDVGVGICTAHSSPIGVTITIITGANTVMINGRAAATGISIGIASCGHATIAVSQSTMSRFEKNGAHRVGDVGLTAGGNYTMIQGSPNVGAGG